MTMYPVVPDLVKYPGTGRSLKDTLGEIGLAGHWIKLALHYMFIYKAKVRLGWHLIPEWERRGRWTTPQTTSPVHRSRRSRPFGLARA
jgi:hypothetical protein